MKIFNWVHHRFHKKSVAEEDSKKSENDKITLLEDILAIGTLGNDLSKSNFHLKDVPYSNIHQIMFFPHDHEDDDDGDNEEEDHEAEMECPLVLKASKHGFHHVQKQQLDLLISPPCDDDDDNTYKVAKSSNCNEEVTEKSFKKSEERTTLADLLNWGDSEKNLLNQKLCDHFHVLNNHVVTESMKQSNTLISEKKKKIEKDDSTHPIKKTKRLMRKMLKKKIHPDIGSQKKENMCMLPDHKLTH